MTPAERLEAYDYLAHRLIALNERVGMEAKTTNKVFAELNRLAGMAREIRGESLFETIASDLRHREFMERMKS